MKINRFTPFGAIFAAAILPFGAAAQQVIDLAATPACTAEAVEGTCLEGAMEGLVYESKGRDVYVLRQKGTDVLVRFSTAGEGAVGKKALREIEGVFKDAASKAKSASRKSSEAVATPTVSYRILRLADGTRSGTFSFVIGGETHSEVFDLNK